MAVEQSSQVGQLRVKNKRCQRLVTIVHDYDATTRTYKVTRTWRDVEKQFAMQNVLKGTFDFVTVAAALNIDFPEDEVEIQIEKG